MLGPHLEFGHAWARGVAQVPDVFANPDGRVVAFASFVAGARASLGRHWAGVFETDWGLTMRGVKALVDGREVVSSEAPSWAFAPASRGNNEAHLIERAHGTPTLATSFGGLGVPSLRKRRARPGLRRRHYGSFEDS